jgi:hypothetical protein
MHLLIYLVLAQIFGARLITDPLWIRLVLIQVFGAFLLFDPPGRYKCFLTHSYCPLIHLFPHQQY